jgi:fermentation-respiration switch protein FrsA (DUF1100 family)
LSDRRVSAFAGGLAAAAGAYGVILGGLYLGQRRLLFRPARTLPPPWAYGLSGIEVVSLSTADGLALTAWYSRPPRPDMHTVLYLHGNKGHIGYRANHLRRMARCGWGVFLLEYRGYGGNPGRPSEAGLLCDAQAALTELRSRGIPPQRILLWGESLGSGLAIALAAEHPVAAVLLESPYTSIADAAQIHYPYVPARRMVKDRFDSMARIGRVRAPILIMQGMRDRVVPPAMGRTLARAATAPVEMWAAPDAGHTGLLQAGAVEAAADFVRRRVPGASAQRL